MEIHPNLHNISNHLLYQDVEDLEIGLPIKASYYRHPESGLIFQHPVPDVETLRSFYPSDYRSYVVRGFVHRLKLLQARFLIDKFSGVLPDQEGSILEIGSGGGHLMIQFRQQGYKNLTAMDWEKNVQASLEAHGVKFISGDIESDLKISSTFDVIILNNVIEHLANPGKVLGRLKGLLKPKGRVLLVTPNEHSLSHRLFRRNWSGLHAPRHVYIFNPNSLLELARSQGYRGYYKLLVDPSSWAISFQNFVRDQLRPPPPYKGTSWYTLIILPACLVVATLEHLFRLSSSMLVVLARE